jgi:hypothetical protein
MGMMDLRELRGSEAPRLTTQMLGGTIIERNPGRLAGDDTSGAIRDGDEEGVVVRSTGKGRGSREEREY